MALTANTLPSIVPSFALPVDASMQFAAAQVVTATGYVNNTNAVVTLGMGRFTGMLALDLAALFITSTDETYKFFLFGSNDVAFGNGNVDVLAAYDYGLAANRSVATILGTNYSNIPPTNRAGLIEAFPFTNLRGGIVYNYAKLYAVLAGTTPSVTLSAWISPIEMKV